MLPYHCVETDDRIFAAAVINILAQALYEVFAAHSDPMLVHMQEATFAYFRLSDFCVSGTMSLLAW